MIILIEQKRTIRSFPQGVEIRIVSETCRGHSGIERTTEQIEGEWDEPGIGGRTRQERQSTGGVVEALGCGYLEQAVDIGLGGGVAQPGAEQGAELEGIAEVGLGVEGHFDFGQGRVEIIAPQEVSPTEMGAGVARVEGQGAGEVSLGADSISGKAGVPAHYQGRRIVRGGLDRLGESVPSFVTAAEAGECLASLRQDSRGPPT
jgi:hypothetical protein